MTQPDGAANQLETLRGLVNGATHRLLGDTIAVSDEDWRAASRLPGWSRGHVASHIARQADGMVRLTEWARTGERHDMYASAEQRETDIAAGSDRTGLELQIDLDTSAGRLDQAFDGLDEQAWDTIVELRGGTKVPARLLPLSRLLEVVVHHVDLDIGLRVRRGRECDRRVAAGVVRVPGPEPRGVSPAGPHVGLRLHHLPRQRR